jgi:ATP-dependent Zn protease
LFEAAYVGTEEWHVSRSQFVAKIDVAMGGRAAEEIVFGKDKVETFVEQEEFF